MIYVYAAIVAMLLAAGGYGGYRVMDGKLARAEQATKDATASALRWQEARDREVVKEKIVTKFVDRKVEVAGAIREVIKEVPLKLSCEIAPSGVAVLPGEFRRLHDRIAAAASAAYSTPGAPDAATVAAQSIAPSEVLDGIGANYANCASNAVQLMSLQEYVKSEINKEVEK